MGGSSSVLVVIQRWTAEDQSGHGLPRWRTAMEPGLLVNVCRCSVADAYAFVFVLVASSWGTMTFCFLALNSPFIVLATSHLGIVT